MTRNPTSAKALALAAIGADVVRGNMSKPASLRQDFARVFGFYSVQIPMISGVEPEIPQGQWITDVAREIGVEHPVSGPAGADALGPGISS